MDMLSDVALLSRIQFALTVAYHFIFVPLSIGLGLILAIFATKYHRSRSEADGNAMRFWVRIFTATFAIGVATGITMEFSFGTNWADYSRFVGDIFGAPLAAEALFAFFLESVFLGVLLFGRNKVSSLFYTVSRVAGVGRFVPVARCGSSSRTRGCRRPPAPSWPPTARRPSSPTSWLRRSTRPRCRATPTWWWRC